ncbi:MAG: hypothetical protein NC924_04970 [Candidatus Omnitrophica bacterium]|nr:hypothetical protein [Candidatus Omnitrophota bacterium]
MATDVAGSGLALGQGVPMEIAAWSVVGFTNYSDAIDEFKIYNQALSAENIAAEYQKYPR